MPFTGELEHLPIVDVVQLVHTTRKSGVFTVRSSAGESTLVFSNGRIVGANHISDTIRIGTVLVKMGTITLDDLKLALKAANAPEKDRTPLLVGLLRSGKLKRDDAVRGLKKLVEMTIVDLIGWTKGTFTFDTETPVFSPDGTSAFGDSAEDVGIDAQMVLMDALRIFDERERDRANGKDVPPFDSLYADILPGENMGRHKPAQQSITAEDLGLDDLDRLEKRIPRPAAEMELFDPVEIHRQKIREVLAGFPAEEQDAFVAFLKRSDDRRPGPDAASQQAGNAVILFSADRLISHAVMTICNDEGVPVFALDNEAELERTISQCLSSLRTPVVVLDAPAGAGMPEEKVSALRDRIRRSFAAVPLVQFAPPQDGDYALRCYAGGSGAVLPKPAKEVRKETFVRDTIAFLGAFKAFIRGFHDRPDTAGHVVKELKSSIRSLRELTNPSDAALVILAAVAEMFDRAVTFLVRPTELTGERSIGVSADKSMGPSPADRLKIPLAKPSVFREVIEKGTAFYGESSDEAMTGLFRDIGKPRSSSVVLVPVTSDRKVVAIVYGDFGKKEAAPVQLDILEVLAQQVGIVLEYALFRRQVAKAQQRP